MAIKYDKNIPIIDASQKPSWVKRNRAVILAWAPAAVSLIGAFVSWYNGATNTTATREAVIAEHRPVLEITSFGFADKYNMPVHLKNSGRSTAFKVRADNWLDMGNYPSPGPPRFTPIKTFGLLQEYLVDIPTSGVSEINLPIVPSLEWLKAYEHFDDDTSIRLRGAIHYEDSAHHPFELPFCYESFQPSKLEKPGAIPCFETKSVQLK